MSLIHIYIFFILAVCNSKSFSYLGAEGVILHQTIKKMKCTYALSINSQENLKITKCLYFDPNSDGRVVWNDLYEQGGFLENGKIENVYGEMGVGIAAQVHLQVGGVKNLEMCLAWDMPIISFPGGRKKYYKYYTKFFGSSDATLKIVDYTLNHYKKWEEDIYFYQKKVLLDK